MEDIASNTEIFFNEIEIEEKEIFGAIGTLLIGRLKKIE